MKLRKGHKLFEVTKINRNGSTGKRLAIVTARSKKMAANALHWSASKVRVFPVRIVKKRMR